MDGNIVVDGVLASCYASFDHDLAHIMMSPIRLFPDMINWMFSEDNGYSVYVDTVKDLGMFAQSFGSKM